MCCRIKTSTAPLASRGRSVLRKECLDRSREPVDVRLLERERKGDEAAPRTGIAVLEQVQVQERPQLRCSGEVARAANRAGGEVKADHRPVSRRDEQHLLVGCELV